MASTFLFNEAAWFTPNTYDANFRPVPETSGIYCIVLPETDFENKKVDYSILYIGSSKNLSGRYKSHEVITKLQEEYGYVRFYFQEIEDHYLEIEKALIRLLKPRYNKQWR